MRKTSFEADSLREGLKAKGRLRRAAAGKQAVANGVAPNSRNDLLPALKIEGYRSRACDRIRGVCEKAMRLTFAKSRTQ
jgi:hypothetical protein